MEGGKMEGGKMELKNAEVDSANWQYGDGTVNDVYAMPKCRCCQKVCTWSIAVGF
jgi:hypothetical protein